MSAIPVEAMPAAGHHPAPLVLVVEDDAKIRAAVREALRETGARVVEAATGAEALARAGGDERPNLIILDLGLPDTDGIQVCRRVREWSSVPIIVLSARHRDDEKAQVLDAGADDYMTKPFSTVELRARVRAQLRRASMAPVPGGDVPLAVGGLVVDLARHSVARDGETIHLTKTEWDLFHTLITHAGRTMTHRQLFSAVWGASEGDAQQYLRVYVAHLRRKLEPDPYRPRYIVTDPGVGYRFEVAGPVGKSRDL